MNEIPQYALEHMLAYHYGWSLDEIRSLDLYDFFCHLKVCVAREISEREFQMSLVGVSSGASSAPNIPKPKKSKSKGHKTVKTFDPNVGNFI